jgi:hypothetical protein
MIPPADDELGRVVVVAAGFALWKGGRCIAAARWGDIDRLRAYRPASETTGAIRLVVELRDGTVLEYHESAPGFDAFLDRAVAMLPGLLAFAAWHPALVLAPPGGDGVVLFNRTQPKLRPTRRPSPDAG